MINRTLCAVALGCLVVFPTMSAADSFKRIRKAADFSNQVVGRNLVFEHGTAIIHKNGKTSGKLKRDGKYYGSWVWQNGFYCRNLVIKGKETGTNCQKVEISGKQLRLTRDKGEGQVTNLTIK